MNLTKPFPEEERPLLAKFYKFLNKKKREELSYVIDEVERSVYWETRRELLMNLINVLYNNGVEALVENLKYRINKSKPL